MSANIQDTPGSKKQHLLWEMLARTNLWNVTRLVLLNWRWNIYWTFWMFLKRKTSGMLNCWCSPNVTGQTPPSEQCWATGPNRCRYRESQVSSDVDAMEIVGTKCGIALWALSLTGVVARLHALKTENVEALRQNSVLYTWIAAWTRQPGLWNRKIRSLKDMNTKLFLNPHTTGQRKWPCSHLFLHSGSHLHFGCSLQASWPSLSSCVVWICPPIR